jgi:hypothetical protein
MKSIFFSILVCFVIPLLACDNSPTKKVSNLAVVKITDANERSQEFIVKYDSLNFSMASSEQGAGWGGQYLHKVSFYEDDAGQIMLTLRKGYTFSVSPVITLGDVQESEARIRLQQKYNFDELTSDGSEPTPEAPIETPQN